MLGTIQQQLQALTQATTSMAGAINQLATIQQAGQAAGAAGNAGAANATVAAAPANQKFHRSLMATILEQSSYLDYSSKSTTEQSDYLDYSFKSIKECPINVVSKPLRTPIKEYARELASHPCRVY